MLMFIFLVYVQNQFKILKHSFKLLNKRNDYNDVSTKLDTMLQKLKITAQNNKNLLLSTASKRPPLSKGGSVATSNVDSTITALNANMEKLHGLFNKSNESIKQFFSILDTNILGQMFEKLATISSNSSNQAITNDNIRNAISQLITHSTHSNTFRKEDISSILNEHNIDLTEEQKKSLLATISLDMLEANHTAQSSAIDVITPPVVAPPPLPPTPQPSNPQPSNPQPPTQPQTPPPQPPPSPPSPTPQPAKTQPQTPQPQPQPQAQVQPPQENANAKRSQNENAEQSQNAKGKGKGKGKNAPL
jgi:hypothetical protein